MKLELFTLCEGAYNGSGRLTIVNTYDILKSKVFPLIMNAGIAMKFSFTPEEQGIKIISMEVIHEETSTMVGKMESKVNLPVSSEVGYLNMAANIQNMAFPNPGWYSMSIKVDGNEIFIHRVFVKIDE